MRRVIVYIQKGWKKTANAARVEAERQALEKAVDEGAAKVEPTGRTFHERNDWGFEFRYEIPA